MLQLLCQLATGYGSTFLSLLNDFNFKIGVCGYSLSYLPWLPSPIKTVFFMLVLAFLNTSISSVNYYTSCCISLNLALYLVIQSPSPRATPLPSPFLAFLLLRLFSLAASLSLYSSSYFSRFSMMRSLILMHSMLRNTQVFYSFSHYFSFEIYLLAKLSYSCFTFSHFYSFCSDSMLEEAECCCSFYRALSKYYYWFFNQDTFCYSELITWSFQSNYPSMLLMALSQVLFSSKQVLQAWQRPSDALWSWEQKMLPLSPASQNEILEPLCRSSSLTSSQLPLTLQCKSEAGDAKGVGEVSGCGRLLGCDDVIISDNCILLYTHHPYYGNSAILFPKVQNIGNP